MPVAIRAKTLLDAVTVTGAGAHKGILKSGDSAFTLQATLGPAGTRTATVEIEVSNDAVGWISMGTITLTDLDDTDGFAANASWSFIRANVTALGAGASVTALLGN